MSMVIGEKCIGCSACIKVCPVAAITGIRRERHVIISSRCIECGACGRVCPPSAITDDQGKTIARRMPRSTWAKPVFDLSHCISCGTCAQKCPASCITMSPGDPGGNNSWPTLAHPDACVSCSWCAFYCPMACIQVIEPAPGADGGELSPGTAKGREA